MLPVANSPSAQIDRPAIRLQMSSSCSTSPCFPLADVVELAAPPLLPRSASPPLAHSLHPARPLAARRTLAARLVPVEVHPLPRGPHHAGGVVHHDDAGGAEERVVLARSPV